MTKCTSNRKITSLLFIYITCVHRKKKKTTLLSRQACFMIAHSSGDLYITCVHVHAHMRSLKCTKIYIDLHAQYFYLHCRVEVRGLVGIL